MWFQRPGICSPTFPQRALLPGLTCVCGFLCLHLHNVASSGNFLLVKAEVTLAPQVPVLPQPREPVGGPGCEHHNRQVQNEGSGLNTGRARTQRTGRHGQPTLSHCPGMSPAPASDRTHGLPGPHTFAPTSSSKQNHLLTQKGPE